MNAGLQTQTRITSIPPSSVTPVQSRLLQRSSADHAGPATAPPIVHEVLCSPGQPFAPERHTFVEQRFGHDFSRVQVHAAAPTIQAKLAINQPNNRYEQEADQVADAVMRMSEPWVQREVEPEEEEEFLKTKTHSSQVTEVTSNIESRIQSLKGGGQPLSEPTRTFFEPRFGYDFGGVKIHTGSKATEAAEYINAKAFTKGRDIVFGEGQYSPYTSTGKHLIAHELAHIQQNNNSDTTPLIHRYPWGALNEWAKYKGKKLAEESAAKTADIGLEAAKKKVKELRSDTAKGKDPNKTEREEIEKDTGVTLDANPYVGISDIDIEAVWEASASGHQPPWVLLALWSKEGSTRTRTNGKIVSASSESNARTIVRSYIYYVDLGADHFIHYTAVTGSDNITSFTDADVPTHDTAFKNAINGLVAKKFLASDPSAQINNELKVTKNLDDTYTVEPTTKFYANSLRLVDAFFSSLQFEKTYKELGNKVPSKAMTYAKWNLRSFEDFLKSAESHRKEPEYSKGTGEAPSVEEWALEKTPKKTEWKQARVNAIRFKFYLIVYKKIFSGGIPEGLMG